MKQQKIKRGVVCLLLLFSFLMVPVKAHAHYDFIATVTRMSTVLPTALLRASAFLVEGVLDGAIEGLFGRKGFLHGESRFM